MEMHKSVRGLLLMTTSLLVVISAPLIRWAIRRRTQHLDAQKSAQLHVRKHIQ